MTSREDLDPDDDFSEIYKTYTGPLGSNAQDKTTTNKMCQAGSNEEDEVPDPNAVPTDFTSREAKVWAAKSKATERNWKKRKEEELICKICGESGHFTQGCPSTLGGRKSQDFLERVPAREPNAKALFSEKVVNKIEKDIGCKIKIEEKFIIVSGRDRLILKKGVDAVHKIKAEGEIKPVQKFPEEDEHKVSSSARISRSRSPERRSPRNSRFGLSDTQKSNPNPSSLISRSKSPEHRSPDSRFGRSDTRKSHPGLNNTAHIPHRYDRNEKVVEDNVREDLQKMSGVSPQAYGSDGGRGRSSYSKSPALPSYLSNSYNSYEGHGQNRGAYRTDAWNIDRGISDMHSGRNFENPSVTKTLDEIEFQYRREAMELARLRDKAEDEENYKHRETIREMGEIYMKKVTMMKGTHAKMWEEFLQHEGQRRQQYLSSSGNGGYKQPSHLDFDNSSGSIHHFSGANMSIDSRGRFRNAMDSYPSSRPQDNYGNFERQRRDEFGKPYNRF